MSMKPANSHLFRLSRLSGFSKKKKKKMKSQHQGRPINLPKEKLRCPLTSPGVVIIAAPAATRPEEAKREDKVALKGPEGKLERCRIFWVKRSDESPPTGLTACWRRPGLGTYEVFTRNPQKHNQITVPRCSTFNSRLFSLASSIFKSAEIIGPYKEPV